MGNAPPSDSPYSRSIGAAVATSTKRRSPAGSPGSHARALIDVPPDAPVGGRSGPSTHRVRGRAVVLLGFRSPEARVEVGQDVVDGLEPDGQADQVGGDRPSPARSR